MSSLPDVLVREGRRQATIHGWYELDADVFAQGWAAAKATTEPAVELEVEPVAPTTVAPLVAWDSWWCSACGNRYTVEVDRCSCGQRLEPVTVQIVARP